MSSRPESEKVANLLSVDGMALDAAIHGPSAHETGAVVLVHGITADLDEGGMYGRLADRLASGGYGVLRFSFRGHGCSAGTQRGVTIAGELLDLQAAVERARQEFSGPVSVVASSFGAVTTLLSLPYLKLDRLALWNPILDLHRTFLEPELPWGIENFGARQQKDLIEDGFLLVDGEFELGRVLFDEFRRYDPAEEFLASTVPTLVVHGDQDSYVSYDIAEAAAEARGCEFHTVVGSDHGFDTEEREDEAIEVTVAWLTTPAES